MPPLRGWMNILWQRNVKISPVISKLNIKIPVGASKVESGISGKLAFFE